MLYSRQCGNEFANESIYCNYCGTKQEMDDRKKLSQQANVDDLNRILFVYKPKFITGYVGKKILPFFIFLALFFNRFYDSSDNLNS